MSKVLASLAVFALALLVGCGSEDSPAPTAPGAKLVASGTTAGGAPYQPSSSSTLESSADPGGLTGSSESVGGQGDRVALFEVAQSAGNVDGSVVVAGSVMAAAEGTELTRLVWQWGDGSSTEGFPPMEYTYSTAGEHTLNLVAYNDQGQTQSISLALDVPHAIVDSPADIEALAGFTHIAGDLKVEETDLTGLGGLEQIGSVGGSLIIQHNASLASIEGLSGLTDIAGALVLGPNPSLLSLTGLENLRSIGAGAIPGSALYIDGSSVSDLDPLQSLEHVESMRLRDNANLTDISALSGLGDFQGRLIIERNALLQNLDGLEGITVVGANESYPGWNGNLQIDGNPVLNDLSALSNLKRVRGYMSVSYNAALTSLAGLENLESVGGSLHFNENPSLASLDALTSLTSVGWELGIWSQPMLASANLPSLASIGSNLAMSTSSSLPALNLGALETVGGNLDLYDNDLFTSIDLSSLTSVGGNLSISDNGALTDFNLGLGSVGGDIFFWLNSALAGVSLPNLTSVGGNVAFSENAALASFSLSSLGQIDGSLTFNDNPALTSFDLSALNSVAQGGCLCGNAQLPNGQVQSLVEGLIADGSPDSFQIFGNFQTSTRVEIVNPNDERISLSLGIPAVEGASVSVNGTVLPGDGPEIIRIEWDWGDGTQAESFFPATHTYSGAGTYTVTATGVNGEGGAKSQSIAVTIE